MFSLYFKNRSLNGPARAFFPLTVDLCSPPSAPLALSSFLLSNFDFVISDSSHRKKFPLALRPHNACHYAKALERVRGKAPGRQIVSRTLVRNYAKKPVSEFRATARDLSSRRLGRKIHGV